VLMMLKLFLAQYELFFVFGDTPRECYRRPLERSRQAAASLGLGDLQANVGKCPYKGKDRILRAR
jgi:hypothetical protein